MADLGEGPGGPSPPLFWVTDEEMTEGKKANRAKKLSPPPPPISSRSGSATAIALQNDSVVLESQLFSVFKISTRPTKFTIGVVHFSGLPPVKSGSLVRALQLVACTAL